MSTARQPLVEWQVLGACNYACSYCIQRERTRTGRPSPEELGAVVAFLASLPGRWEIKMSGGEPFALPGFTEGLVPALLSRTVHRLSVLTNLSASDEELARFAELTRGRLGIVSASLHQEHVPIEDFVAKAAALRARLEPAARLVVNAVVVPGRLGQVAAAKRAVLAAGLPFFPQLYKVGGGVHRYAPEEQQEVDAIVGPAPTTRSANVAPSHRGRTCFAGVEYVVLTQRGEAWSCRAARRVGEGRLGSVAEGVTLRRAPAPCAYDLCPCTTPANRGLVEGLL